MLDAFRPSLPALLLFALFSQPGQASDIYRCTTPDGKTLFQQIPCGPMAGEAVEIRDTHTGWEGLREGERDLLDQAKPTRKKKRSSSKSSDNAKAKAKQAERCRKKRRQLDAVRTQLRRGYKPAQGEKLRRRRADYEDYIRHNCE